VSRDNSADTRTREGNTLLMIAVAMDHSAVQSLLAKGVDTNITNKLGRCDSVCYNAFLLFQVGPHCISLYCLVVGLA
jgi:hypothetical protein